MNADSIPKYLFLNEENDQISDRRLTPIVNYGDSHNAIKTKKMNNVIKFEEPLNETHQINSIAYSNKLGLLVVSAKDCIYLTNFKHIESMIVDEKDITKSLKQHSMRLGEKGKIYLTPNQESLFILNEQKIILFDLKSLKKISEVENKQNVTFMCFVNDLSVIYWSFLSKCYINEDFTFDFNSMKQIGDKETCTSVSIVNSHIIISNNFKDGEAQDIELSIWDITGSRRVSEFSIQKIGNPANYMLEFECLISLFPIRQEKEGEFGNNDIYGLILGFWDIFEEEPDRRYLNFMRGNLLGSSESSLKIRGQQLFLSPSDKRNLYFNGEEKLPFEVQILKIGQLTVILIEKAEVIYTIDNSLEFEKLNLYSMVGLHEIKQEASKYFKGMCLMKNILQSQRKAPKNCSDPICDLICDKYEGQFLSLYFSAKQTELTVPFPCSLLVLGDNKIYRKYAICTESGIQEYQIPKIQEQMKKIKKSPFLCQIKNLVDIPIGSQQSSEGKPSVEEKMPNLITVKQTVVEGLSSNLSNQDKQKSKVPEKTGCSLFSRQSLFGRTNTQNKESLFGIFGTQKGSLFNKNQKSTLFGNKSEASSGSLFNKPNSNQPSQTKLSPNQGKPETSQNKEVKDDQNGRDSDTNQSKNEQVQQKPKSSGIFNNSSNLLAMGLADDKEIETSKASIVGEIAASPLPEKTSSNPRKELFGQNTPLSLLDDLSLSKQAPNQEIFAQKPPLFSQQTLEKGVTNAFASKSLFQPDASKDKPKETKQKQKTAEVEQWPVRSQEKENNQVEAKRQKVEPTTKIDLVVSQKEIVGKQTHYKKGGQNLLLEEFAELMGVSIDMIPDALKTLNPSQLEALVKTMKPVNAVEGAKGKQAMTMADKKRQKILGKETGISSKEAQENLNKKQDYMLIVEIFEDLKSYVKDWKTIRKQVKNKNLFTIQNAQEMIKDSMFMPSQIKEKELKTLNPILNSINLYRAKMDYLERKYANIFLEQNFRRNYSVQKQLEIQKQNMEQLERKINIVTYYRSTLIEASNSNSKLKQNISKLFSGIRQTSKGKTSAIGQIMCAVYEKTSNLQYYSRKVGEKLKSMDMMIQANNEKRQTESKLKSKKQQQNRVGRSFRFNLNDMHLSPSSDEDANSQLSSDKDVKFQLKMKSPNYSNFPRSKNSGLDKGIKISFKPQKINMNEEKKFSTSFFVFNDDYISDGIDEPLVSNEALSIPPENDRRMSSSSIRKSAVNFKEKIPIRKEQGKEQNSKIDRGGMKPFVSSGSDSSDDDIGSGDDNQDIMPRQFNRNVSFAPTQANKNALKLVPQQKVAKSTQNSKDILQIKQTKETFIDEKPSKGSSEAETRKQEKPKQTFESQSIFGVKLKTTSADFGKKTQIQKTDENPLENIQQSPMVSKNKVGSIFANSTFSKPTESDKESTKKKANAQQAETKQPKEVKKEQKMSLFGEKSSSFGQNSGKSSLFGNMGTKEGSLFGKSNDSNSQKSEPTKVEKKGTLQTVTAEEKTEKTPSILGSSPKSERSGIFQLPFVNQKKQEGGVTKKDESTVQDSEKHQIDSIIIQQSTDAKNAFESSNKQNPIKQSQSEEKGQGKKKETENWLFGKKNGGGMFSNNDSLFNNNNNTSSGGFATNNAGIGNTTTNMSGNHGTNSGNHGVAFGAQNRFNTSASKDPEQKKEPNQPTFNPNSSGLLAPSSSSFNPSSVTMLNAFGSSSGQKSFSNLGSGNGNQSSPGLFGNKGNNIFGNNQSNQSTSNLFNQGKTSSTFGSANGNNNSTSVSGVFDNNNANNANQQPKKNTNPFQQNSQQQNSLFGGQSTPNNIFGNDNSSNSGFPFQNGNGFQQKNGGNFMSNFKLSVPSTPSSANAMMLKPRK